MRVRRPRWSRQLGRNPQTAALVAVVALIAANLVLLLAPGGVTRQSAARPPTPPAPALHIASTSAPPTGPGRTPPQHRRRGVAPVHCSIPPRTGGTAPARICIPRLGVDAAVMLLGLNADRTVQVPPLSRVGDAGWYRYSAPPGAVGPTVILGHVDSAQYGEGVFFRLGTLRPGGRVLITRGDGMIATYRVDRVAQIPKSRFPTNAVYGATSGPAIRLVTCGGRFDSTSGSYVDNIIAYGTLLGLRHG